MKVVIIDNDSEIIDGLKLMILKFCPEINELATANSIKSGIDVIAKNKPDLVFLDVELDEGTGMDLLSKIGNYNFEVVFITAHNKYAIDAFKFSAIDFIQKPIGVQELHSAVQKAKSSLLNRDLKQQLAILKESFSTIKNDAKKIVLKDSESLYFLNVSDIIMCKAEGSYTEFYLNSNQKIIISKGLKEYDELLENYGFIRTHHSYLVNIHKIKRFDKANGGVLVLENNHEVPVSQRKREQILVFLGSM